MPVFLDNQESAVVLVGSLLPDELLDAPSKVQVLVRDGVVRDYPVEMLPFLTFITTPHPESSVRGWLAEAGAPGNALDLLVAGAHVALIPPAGTGGALEAFRGMSLFALGVPILELSEDGLVFVGTAPDDLDDSVPISELLASVLWDAAGEEDIPTAARRLSRSTDDTARVERDTLFGLESLLGQALARLEMTKASLAT